jgi:hypothetical protein
MVVYNLYIFDRRGTCLFYKEWKRLHRSLRDNVAEDRKLVFGLTFSLQQLVQTLNPFPGETGDFQSFRTTKAMSKGADGKVQYAGYSLHHFETASGLRFVMNTDDECIDMRHVLKRIYANIYVEHVVKNPLALPGKAIQAPRFVEALEAYVNGLPQFK